MAGPDRISRGAGRSLCRHAPVGAKFGHRGRRDRRQQPAVYTDRPCEHARHGRELFSHYRPVRADAGTARGRGKRARTGVDAGRVGDARPGGALQGPHRRRTAVRLPDLLFAARARLAVVAAIAPGLRHRGSAGRDRPVVYLGLDAQSRIFRLFLHPRARRPVSDQGTQPLPAALVLHSHFARGPAAVDHSGSRRLRARLARRRARRRRFRPAPVSSGVVRLCFRLFFRLRLQAALVHPADIPRSGADHRRLRHAPVATRRGAQCRALGRAGCGAHAAGAASGALCQ